MNMKNANEMYQYCIKNNYGAGMTKNSAIKNFSLIENDLGEDERVLFVFTAIHNYVSLKQHDGNFAYAITDKRFIMAQKKLMGENFYTIPLNNINDIALSSNMLGGIITASTINQTFNIFLNKDCAKRVCAKIHEVLANINKYDNKLQLSSADEILKFKQLLDQGIITQEEFEKKKKELLK